MTRIHFCANLQSMDDSLKAWPAERNVFALRTGSDIPGVIEALRSGRDVVANELASATGWTLPVPAEVTFDEELMREQNITRRNQCESRSHRARLFPYQVAALDFIEANKDAVSRVNSLRFAPVEDILAKAAQADLPGRLIIAAHTEDANKRAAELGVLAVTARNYKGFEPIRKHLAAGGTAVVAANLLHSGSIPALNAAVETTVEALTDALIRKRVVAGCRMLLARIEMKQEPSDPFNAPKREPHSSIPQL